MLIAWAKGKRGRDHEGYEDEIVSAVLGPLRYFQTQQRVQVIREILFHSFDDSPSRDISRKPISNCWVEFWPNIAPSGRIEPDVTVEIIHEDRSRTLLVIEAKWKSGQHDGQLWEQWHCATEHHQASTVLQIFLTRKPHDQRQMMAEHLVHQARLVSLTWSRLALILHNFADDPFLAEWARDVLAFLSEVGQKPFRGFSSVLGKHILGRENYEPRWTFQPTLIRIAELESYSILRSTTTTAGWIFPGQEKGRK